MQPTPATRKTIALSPEALAAIKLPLEIGAHDHINWLNIRDANGILVAKMALYGHTYEAIREVSAFIAALVNEALTPTAPAARFCDYEDCTCDPLPGFDFCAYHQSEHDTNIRAAIAANAPVEPETTTELAQAVTTQLESDQLAAQYTAANDARREG